MQRVPTSWYDGEHLYARLKAYDVPKSDPAWCVVEGHHWGPFVPVSKPISTTISADPPNTYERLEAYRFCMRCDEKQAY